MRLLVSVRSVDEALLAACHGADFIDLKEPSHGALGGLALDTIGAIVAALRAHGIALPVSATIGEPPRERLLEQVAAVAACGVDYVKVGVAPGCDAPALIDALASCGAAVVPVFIADHGIDFAGVAQAVGRQRFPALMLDTQDKGAGSLCDRVPRHDLARFVAAARRGGAMAGLAGALQPRDLPALAALAPDFAGFRSAVCAGDRRAALDAQRLQRLVAHVRTSDAAPAACPVAHAAAG